MTVALPLAGLILVLAGRFRPTLRRTHTADGPYRDSAMGDGVDAIAARLKRFVDARRRPMVTPESCADWADALARSVRRGTTLHRSLTEIVPEHAPLAAATDDLRHRLRRGASAHEACARWQPTHTAGGAPEHLAAVRAVLVTMATVGGGAGAPLDRLAASMRSAAADALERHAQSAQAQISARVLTLVPVAMLALLLLIDDDVRSVVTSDIGAAVVVAGLLLNLAGAWWLRRIIRAAA